MCFEWDKRYFREQAELKSRQKVDELIRNSEAAARAGQETRPADPPQPAPEQEELAS